MDLTLFVGARWKLGSSSCGAIDYVEVWQHRKFEMEGYFGQSKKLYFFVLFKKKELKIDNGAVREN